MTLRSRSVAGQPLRLCSLQKLKTELDKNVPQRNCRASTELRDRGQSIPTRCARQDLHVLKWIPLLDSNEPRSLKLSEQLVHGFNIQA